MPTNSDNTTREVIRVTYNVQNLKNSMHFSVKKIEMNAFAVDKKEAKKKLLAYRVKPVQVLQLMCFKNCSSTAWC